MVFLCKSECFHNIQYCRLREPPLKPLSEKLHSHQPNEPYFSLCQKVSFNCDYCSIYERDILIWRNCFFDAVKKDRALLCKQYKNERAVFEKTKECNMKNANYYMKIWRIPKTWGGMKTGRWGIIACGHMGTNSTPFGSTGWGRMCFGFMENSWEMAKTKQLQGFFCDKQTIHCLTEGVMFSKRG